jgi:hypothetical protein
MHGLSVRRATFTNEMASGWQQVNLSTPVAISANTTYVASYHSPVGHYSVTNNFFASSGTDNPLCMLSQLLPRLPTGPIATAARVVSPCPRTTQRTTGQTLCSARVPSETELNCETEEGARLMLVRPSVRSKKLLDEGVFGIKYEFFDCIFSRTVRFSRISTSGGLCVQDEPLPSTWGVHQEGSSRGVRRFASLVLALRPRSTVLPVYLIAQPETGHRYARDRVMRE